ncbi:dihydrofolate reductase [Deinococcus humi]|uniref:Dihydrofolate reductase n=1 Tax=Deinococcus humi TaxID=662880 RepID=A0A7W8JXM0_9DEIO|nr:dihydrofolate reductase [Deinococcus humi]MBB5365112.1 dihydrofolate reductase [Deinococcus humi]GGO37922.1 dihydrofolate reductase [Deinococcus humi]
MPPSLTFVVAMAENRVIGRDGDLPWRLPADLAHFKRLTVGKPVVMGRKVYDSIGKPLPERQNIVLTRNPAFQAPGCAVVHSPLEALDAAGNVPEIMIIGGEEIYRLYLSQVGRVELTLVHAEIEGDTVFPVLPGEWSETARRERAADERNPYDLTFMTLERVAAEGGGQPD